MDSEVEKLKERLSAETHANQKAAEFGLQLLEENKSLQDTIRKQRTEHEKTLANFMQQTHTLTIKLDVAQQVLKDHVAELEVTKQQAENMRAKMVNNESEHQRQITNFGKVKTQLELECLEKDNTISMLKKNIQELENQIHDASKLQGTFSDTTDSFDQNLQLENQELVSRNREFENKLLELEKELQYARETNEEFRSANQQMQEELVYRENKLADCMLQKCESQEELEVLRSELESLKLGQLDVKKRGNSLFAEVEDNRKSLENEVKTLRSQMNLMKEKDESNQHEIKQMTHQIACLLNMSNHRVDSNYVLKLTQDLSQARGEIEELSLKLKANREKQNSGTHIPSPVEHVSKNKCDGYDFMNTMLEEKEQRIEKLLSELRSINLTKTSLSNRIVQTDKQLYLAEKKNDSLKAEVLKLKQNLNDLKKENSTFSTCNKPEIRVEKLPKCLEKRKTDISGNNNEPAPTVSNVNLKVAGQTELLLDDKENQINVTETKLTKGSINSKGVKDCTRKVSFSADAKEDNSEIMTEKKSKQIGKKAEVSPVFVSSNDASTPSECAQQ